MVVNDGAKGSEFIFLMDRLEQDIGIEPVLEIIKGIKMHAVKTFTECLSPSETQYLDQERLGLLKKMKDEE